MKKYCAVFALASLAAALSSYAELGFSDTYDPMPTIGPRFRIEGSYLYTDGQAGFELGDFWGTFSDLEYPLDGSMYEGRAEYRHYFHLWDVLCGAGVRGQMAKSIDVSGTSTDTDYLFGSEIYYSESDNEADVSIWSADVFVLARPLFMMESKFLQSVELGFFLGYGEHSYEFEDENLDYSYDYGLDRGYVEGPVSRYDVDFTGIRVGGMASMMPVQKLTLSAEVVLIPGMDAEADALWIMRDYPFTHEADGSGAIVQATANYALFEHLDVFLRIRSVSLLAEDGTESGVLDGVEPYEDEEIVEEITNEYVGGEAGIALTF